MRYPYHYINSIRGGRKTLCYSINLQHWSKRLGHFIFYIWSVQFSDNPPPHGQCWVPGERVSNSFGEGWNKKTLGLVRRVLTITFINVRVTNFPSETWRSTVCEWVNTIDASSIITVMWRTVVYIMLTMCVIKSYYTRAVIAINPFKTCSIVLTRIWIALFNFQMTELSMEPGWALASKVINTIDARGICNTRVIFAVVDIHWTVSTLKS